MLEKKKLLLGKGTVLVSCSLSLYCFRNIYYGRTVLLLFHREYYAAIKLFILYGTCSIFFIFADILSNYIFIYTYYIFKLFYHTICKIIIIITCYRVPTFLDTHTIPICTRSRYSISAGVREIQKMFIIALKK